MLFICIRKLEYDGVWQGIHFTFFVCDWRAGYFILSISQCCLSSVSLNSISFLKTDVGNAQCAVSIESQLLILQVWALKLTNSHRQWLTRWKSMTSRELTILLLRG